MNSIGFDNYEIIGENIWMDEDTDSLRKGDVFQVDVIFSGGDL